MPLPRPLCASARQVVVSEALMRLVRVRVGVGIGVRVRARARARARARGRVKVRIRANVRSAYAPFVAYASDCRGVRGSRAPRVRGRIRG